MHPAAEGALRKLRALVEGKGQAGLHVIGAGWPLPPERKKAVHGSFEAAGLHLKGDLRAELGAGFEAGLEGRAASLSLSLPLPPDPWAASRTFSRTLGRLWRGRN
jgi:hypothetical protein